MWVIFSFLYITFLFLGTFIAMTGSSWFIVWIGLEVNMLSFVPLIGMSGKLGSEAVFKYFIVQALGSLLLLFVGLLGSMNVGYGYFIYDLFSNGSILLVLLSLKLGASPMHFWFPSVMEGLDWFGVMLLMTWQKVAPLSLIMIMNFGGNLMIMIGVFSVLVGGLGGLNQLLLRKLLAYSSISHLGWLCCLFMMSEWVGLIYFLSYVLVTMAVLFCLLFSNYVHVIQLYVSGFNIMGLVGGFHLGLFSLGGLPPLFGFFPKWLGILCLVRGGFLYLALIFVVVGLLTLYFYMRIGYSGIMFYDSVWLWGNINVKFIFIGIILCSVSYFILPFVLIGWL